MPKLALKKQKNIHRDEAADEEDLKDFRREIQSKKSILCIPVSYRKNIKAVLYLDNHNSAFSMPDELFPIINAFVIQAVTEILLIPETAGEKRDVNQERFDYLCESSHITSILFLLLKGYTKKQIAEEQSISINTVKHHISKVIMPATALLIFIAACGGGAADSSDTALSVPGKPAIIPGDEMLSLSWETVSTANAYEVWLNTSDDSSGATQQGGDIALTSFSITGLTNGVTYYLWLKAKNSTETSTFSEVAEGTENKYHYIVVNRGRAPFDKDFSGMTVVREDESKGIKVEIKRIEQDKEVFILVRSAKKKGKESGIRSRMENLFLERLIYYRKGLSVPRRTKRYRKIIENIGRLSQGEASHKEKYPKASKLYDITIAPEKGKDAADPAIEAVDIRWTKKSPAYDDETQSEGSCILRSSRFDLSDKEIWEIYIMLNRIENAFRCLKSSLGLRPNFHQIEKRVDAHLFISVLAYHILHIVESRLRLAGNNSSWETIRDIMRTHERITISYKAREEDGAVKKHFIRLNTTLEPEHLEIYRMLQLSPIPLPKKRVIKERKGVVITLFEDP